MRQLISRTICVAAVSVCSSTVFASLVIPSVITTPPFYVRATYNPFQLQLINANFTYPTYINSVVPVSYPEGFTATSTTCKNKTLAIYGHTNDYCTITGSFSPTVVGTHTWLFKINANNRVYTQQYSTSAMVHPLMNLAIMPTLEPAGCTTCLGTVTPSTEQNIPNIGGSVTFTFTKATGASFANAFTAGGTTGSGGSCATSPHPGLVYTVTAPPTAASCTVTGAVTKAFQLDNLVTPAPFGIAMGPNGNLWITSGDSDTNSLAEINSATGATIVTYHTPTTNSGPWGITLGPDGNMWFTENNANKIGRMNPNTGMIMEYTLRSTAQPQGIVAGPDGNLWFTESGASRIGRITTSGTITEYGTGGGGGAGGSGPYGIAVGPDGNIWYTLYNANEIGMINLTTFAVTQYSANLTGNSEPAGITAGRDGSLWFTEANASNIGQITTAGVITEYPYDDGTPGDGSVDITMGPDNNLWFGGIIVGMIAKFEPTPGSGAQFTFYSTGTTHTDSGAITVGPDGNLWATFVDESGYVVEL